MVTRSWLVKMREDQGLSQEDVAKQSGIVQQSYYLIEKGINTPRVETAKRIATVLGFPWIRFYDEETMT